MKCVTKRIALISWLALVAVVLGCNHENKGTVSQTARPLTTSAPNRTICVLQYVSHPLLDAVYGGFREELSRRGYDPTKLRFSNANGDATAASLLADKACKEDCALIFVLATPMAQSVKTACPPTRPILFGAITDPKSAQLVASMDSPGGNLSGTSDQWPYRLQMELIAHIWSGKARVGIPFNPAEANTQYAMEQTRTHANQLGLRLLEVPINSVSEAPQAVDAMARKVDVIYVPADNTAVAAAASIVAAADRLHIPVVAGDPGTFKAGGAVGLGVDYRNLGVINARQALAILSGSATATMPVEVVNRPELYLNDERAARYHIDTQALRKWYDTSVNTKR